MQKQTMRRAPNASARLGETKIMHNGLSATITEYYNSKNITVQFEDGVIVKNRTYYKFQLGEIGHPNIAFQNTMSVQEFAIGYYLKHFGFVKIKSGEWKNVGFADYELDFYHPEKNIAIEYDGAIHKRESSIKNEKIKNALCKKMDIILYRIRDQYLINDVDDSINFKLTKSDAINHRLFDCKEILETILTNHNISFDKDFINFRRDEDAILTEYESKCVLTHARERIGEKIFSKTANQNMTLIAYHDSHNIDVQFDDGMIRTGIYYTQFLEGTVSHPDQLSVDYATMRIGETRVMLNGFEAKICAYRTNKDIDVMFVNDGKIVNHVNYNVFRKGRVGHPDYDTNFLINKNKKIGLIGVTKSGEHIKIIEYRSCTDIDVLFLESNRKLEHIPFVRFQRLSLTTSK